jgi:hypothetical protein
MTDEVMSPLRRRMIEDMTIRRLAPKTQQDYVQRVKNFAAFVGRSPDTATFEDVRVNLSDNETKDACAFPSRPRPASRSNRPDTYQRPPLSTHKLSCETQPVHT